MVGVGHQCFVLVCVNRVGLGGWVRVQEHVDVFKGER